MFNKKKGEKEEEIIRLNLELENLNKKLNLIHMKIEDDISENDTFIERNPGVLNNLNNILDNCDNSNDEGSNMLLKLIGTYKNLS